MAITDRQCAFSDEKPLPNFAKYTVPNCAVDCRATKAYELCGCVPFYYPATPGIIPVCNFTRTECLVRYWGKWIRLAEFKYFFFLFYILFR